MKQGKKERILFSVQITEIKQNSQNFNKQFKNDSFIGPTWLINHINLTTL